MINSKGFLFTGCSFTWGFGLGYYYQYIKNKPLNQIGGLKVYPEQRFQFKYRFSQRVSDYFGRWCLQKDSVSGSDAVSNHWLSYLINSDTSKYNDELEQREIESIEFFEPHDFDVLIYQTSYLNRNVEVFWKKLHKNKIDGGEKFKSVEEALEYAETKESNIHTSIDEFWIQVWEVVYNDMKDILQELEKHNVKIFFIHADDRIPEIMDIYIKERTINISYKGKEFSSINELTNKHESSRIFFDVDFFGNNPPQDYHPTLEVHKSISESIIKRLEDESVERNY